MQRKHFAYVNDNKAGKVCFYANRTDFMAVSFEGAEFVGFHSCCILSLASSKDRKAVVDCFPAILSITD